MDSLLPPSVEGRYAFGLSRCRIPRQGGYLARRHNAQLSWAAFRVFYRQLGTAIWDVNLC